MRYGCVLMLLFLVHVNGFSQNVFRHLTSEDGLDDGTINAIEQDSSGLMWFATFDGLISYDGYRFKNFRPEIGNEESLPSVKTTELFIDSRNNLWITLGGNEGITRYVSEKNKFHTYEIDFLHPRSKLYDIVEFDDLIITNQLRALHYISLDDIHNTRFKTLKVYNQDMEELDRTTNLIRIDDYLIIYNRNIVQNITELFFLEIKSVGNDKIAQVVRKETLPGVIFDVAKFPYDGMICFAMKSGLQIYSFTDPFEYITTIEPDEYFIQILFEGNQIWLASKNNGIYNYDIHTGHITQYRRNPTQARSLLSNIVFSMFKDFSGNVWFGHGEDGLSIINAHTKAFNTYRANPNESGSISGNSILSFCEINNEMFIGTRYNGLNLMIDQESEAPYFEKIEFPSSFIGMNHEYESVWDIKKETDELFWMATSYGLVKAVKIQDDWNFKQFFTHDQVGLIRRIFVDDNRNIWFGGFGGLYLMPYATRDSALYYHYSSDADNPNSLTNIVVSDIFLSSAGNLFIGTMNGLNILRNKYHDLNLTGLTKPALSFEHINAGVCERTLKSNEINSFFEHSFGKVWICTQGGGINIYDEKNENFSFINEDDGLSSNNVFGILRDTHNKLWVSTGKGLTCIDGIAENMKFIRYTVEDGIQGNIFLVNAYYASIEGRLYFGGRNGFTSFSPLEVKENNTPPRIRFSSLALNSYDVKVGKTYMDQIILDKSLDYVEEIKVPHQLNSLRIGVSVIHFQNPENNYLMFKLENFDDQWNTIPANEYYIRYPALPPGQIYLLRVKSIGANGVVSDREKAISIYIKTQWWNTGVAKVGFMLIFITVVLSLSVLIILREKLKLKLKLDNIKIKEDQRKLDFFTNISHDIRTPISLITAPIRNLKENLSEYNRDFIDQQLTLIDRNAQSLLRLVNQLLNFDSYSKGEMTLSLQKVDLKVYVSHIVDNFKELLIDDDKQLKFYLPPEKLCVKIDPDKFEQVLNNILSNAFTHAKEKGEISVSLSKSRLYCSDVDLSESMVEITIFNEGKEIPQDKLDTIFQRYYQAEPSSNGGSGIGLAIARSIIKLHNGHIKAESIENRGVAFYIYIPLLQSEENEFSEDKSKKYYPGLNEYCSKELVNVDLIEINLPEDDRLKVLVIEDNRELRLFLKSILSKDYEFFDADDGNKGVLIAQEEIPDLIISDVMMPGLSGIEVCSVLKEDLRTCHIPVILLTAKGTQENILEGYDTGADAYVVKPFEVNLLISQINSLIENRRVIQEKFQSKGFDHEISDKSYTSKDKIFLKRLKKVILQNIDDQDFNVNKLAEHLNICPTYLYRKLKALTGYSAVGLIRQIRLNNALQLIKSNKYTVKEVCFMTGFNNFSYFIKCFRKEFGVTPTMVNSTKSNQENTLPDKVT